MIDYDFSIDCCGCSACVDACPKQCINQITNKYGFIVPQVDKSVCIDCHICEKICPVFKTEKIEFQDRKMYSAVNKNEEQRAAGSSGSVFYLLAEKTISEGGIVFGASFDEKLQLHHTSAEKMEELRPLLKSKYLQSNTQGVYKRVKDQLSTGRKVLFVGTPCQCNALYKFLGCKKPENLLIADFVCHGVPSQDLFNKSISHWEKKHNCKIVQFEFRRKRPDNIHSFYLKAKELNSHEKYFETSGTFSKFPFYKAFKRYWVFRPSCYHCNFALKDRVSDLTLADFWGIEAIEPSVSKSEFNKGISMVVVNSMRGQYAFDAINHSIVCKEYDVNYAENLNHSYMHVTNETKIVKMIRWSLANLPYSLNEKLWFSRFGGLIKKFVGK